MAAPSGISCGSVTTPLAVTRGVPPTVALRPPATRSAPATTFQWSLLICGGQGAHQRQVVAWMEQRSGDGALHSTHHVSGWRQIWALGTGNTGLDVQCTYHPSNTRMRSHHAQPANKRHDSPHLSQPHRSHSCTMSSAQCNTQSTVTCPITIYESVTHLLWRLPTGRPPLQEQLLPCTCVTDGMHITFHHPGETIIMRFCELNLNLTAFTSLCDSGPCKASWSNPNTKQLTAKRMRMHSIPGSEPAGGMSVRTSRPPVSASTSAASSMASLRLPASLAGFRLHTAHTWWGGGGGRWGGVGRRRNKS